MLKLGSTLLTYVKKHKVSIPVSTRTKNLWKYYKDRNENGIYITDERWEHIYEHHPEMKGFESHVMETIKSGKRKQQPIDPNSYKYSKSYEELPNGNTQIIVVVKFGWKIDENGNQKPNNFVITAFMK